MADKSGQTEQPTQRRLQKAREEGNYPSAKEFVSAIQFLLFLALLGSWGAHWFGSMGQTMRELFEQAFRGEITPQFLSRLAWKMFWTHGMPLVMAGAALMVVTLGIRLATTRFGFSLKKLAPDPNRLNPLGKLRDLPKQNLTTLAQSLLLLPLFLSAVYGIVRGHFEDFLVLPLGTVLGGTHFLGTTLMDLFWKAAGLFVVFGAVDLFRQMRKHQSDLRMSKQEIKDEMKEAEGNPQIKAKIRRLQRDRVRRQMMKDIPKATAVIVNPTHFAVAIRYQMDSMAAPMVIAKGKNYLALRIRQKAMEHEIPIIENPPLARALYKSAEVGQEIPADLYRAVAEILAYIFKLMNGRLPG
jgi:flagellar biosynthetic protein FlhB